MNRIRKLAVPGALVVGMGVAATAMEVVRDPLPDLGAQAAQQPPVAARIPGPESLSSAFRSASRGALPAVVYVKTETAARTVASQVPDQFRGTPMEQFFGGGRQMVVPPEEGSGSGFIISADGYILTNNHVVANTSRVTVVLADKRELSARVVGRDPNTDVAVLKVDAKGLPVAQLGDAESLQTGDWVLALGYPMSLGQTTTAGIVSAKGRSLGIMQRDRSATAPLEHFIQTDAAINPGNSGGPLVDLSGRVVGINTAIASPTGFYAGYGFAVPIDLAKRVAEDLMRDGQVHRPMLGVAIRAVTPADAEVFRLPSGNGAVVYTEPKGPAKDAGIRMGDVIVAVDGQPVADDGDLKAALLAKRPGERVTLDLVRYGSRQRAAVKLGELELEQVRDDAPAEESREPTGRLGFSVMQVTPQVASQYQLPFRDGVVVTRVDRSGPAASALAGGMRVERLNGREVRTVEDVRAAASRLRAGQVVSIVARTPDGQQAIVNYRVGE
ncbi:MAG TPA: trypsin-like peptidase domain-containing protein [Longimicrobiaceae bacterium]|nr:trypsin-like peptidase domain-containing protein [Longimicrobiaceae bacterium]